MVRIDYKEAIALLGDTLEEILKDQDIKINAIILGGYALQALCDEYNSEMKRNTDDIDVYTPDARILVSDQVVISPTGARIQLAENFHAELFDWISGMDHDKNLEKEILAGMNTHVFKTLYKGEKVEIFLPSAEVFIINKLFAYRGDQSRAKDLKDVYTIASILKEQNPSYLKIIEKAIKGLEKEYSLIAGRLKNQ